MTNSNTNTNKITEDQFLELCKQAINNRKKMLKAREIESTEVRQLSDGNYIQLKGEAGKMKGHFFQLIVKKQEGNIVYIKGYRTSFTIEGNYLKRGRDLWLITD